MAQAQKSKTFDFGKYQDYKVAIRALDVALLKSALERGIDVNRYVDDTHPLISILIAPEIPHEEKMAIVDLMLQAGLSTTALVEGTNFSVVSIASTAEEAPIVAPIVIAALKEALKNNQPIFTFSLAEKLKQQAPPAKASPLAILEASESFGRTHCHFNELHELVGLAIKEDPSLRKYSKKLSFWLNPLDVPSMNEIIATFPLTPDQLKQAFNQRALKVARMQAAAEGGNKVTYMTAIDDTPREEIGFTAILKRRAIEALQQKNA